MVKKFLFIVFILCIGILSLMSCSTNKDTVPNRVYHAINTKFNVYYNGNVSFREGLQSLSKNTKDNYTAILPIYTYPPKAEAQSLSPKWDRAIEKASKAIAKHSMFIKGEEKNIYMDEVYMLMGKAYFYRQDYNDAARVFSYVIQTHETSNSWVDAYTWKAQTCMRLNQIANAEENLEMIKADVGVSKSRKVKEHWEAVYTDKLIQQENYEQAALYMSELLSNIKWNKNFKTRCMFIYAQLNQILGQFDEAYKYYGKVIKRAPAYEMSFNANLNMALCEIEKPETKQKLHKMLKDSRNDEYRDQIYYAMAQCDLYRGDTLAGIDNLTSSVFWSISNTFQKATSSIDLAEYYFGHQDYENAQKYYDTLLQVIPQSFPNYANICQRAKILKELVGELLVIKTQDSLQHIALMSESERAQYIEKQIADYNKEKEKRLREEEAKQQLMMDIKKSNSGAKKSTWVFYNPTQVKSGEIQFRKEWGNRVLEDNWFLSNKTAIMQMSDLDENKEENENMDSSRIDSKVATADSLASNNPSQASYYTKNVPFTQAAMDSSNNLIAFALYNSGFIYYDDLKDKRKAVEQWSVLTDRFTEHKLYPSACYLLYRTYAELDNDKKSDYYKNVILEKYPGGEHAKIINNPHYFEELALQKKNAEAFYSETYPLYENRKYKDLLKKCNEGLKKFVNPEIRSKLSYLKAYSQGQLYGIDSLESGMKSICINFPATAVDTLANGILEAIKRSKNPQAPESLISATNKEIKKIKNEEKHYLYDDSRFHFVIFIVDIKNTKINQLKINIANFNKEYFRMNTFDISNFYIDNTSQMITVSKFENKNKAMEYYMLVKNNKKYFEETNRDKDAKIYVISDQNYTLFFKQKEKRKEYDQFFIDNYLNLR